MELICGHLPQICENCAKIVATKNLENDDEVRFQVYMGGHYPSGTSTKCINHYAQIIKARRFQEYDLGSAELNKQKYQQEIPPEIDISDIIKIDLPIMIFAFQDDELSNPLDAREICNQLAQICKFYQESPGGHQTPLIGKDMSFFSETAMRQIKQYHPFTYSLFKEDGFLQ